MILFRLQTKAGRPKLLLPHQRISLRHTNLANECAQHCLRTLNLFQKLDLCAQLGSSKNAAETFAAADCEASRRRA